MADDEGEAPETPAQRRAKEKAARKEANKRNWNRSKVAAKKRLEIIEQANEAGKAEAAKYGVSPPPDPLREDDWAERLAIKSTVGGYAKDEPKALWVDEVYLREINGLGRLQASVKECAAFFNVSISIMVEFMKDWRVKQAYESGRGQGTLSLRRAQFRLAEKNANMAIFMGKNLLGQTDKVEFEHSGVVEVSDARERLAKLLTVIAVSDAPGGGAEEAVVGDERGSDGTAPPRLEGMGEAEPASAGGGVAVLDVHGGSGSGEDEERS